MKKIMVLEDDGFMREELVCLLENSGYETAATDDFEHAAEIVFRENPDLVLLDLNLSGTSGYMICRQIKGAVG